MLNGLSVFMTE